MNLIVNNLTKCLSEGKRPVTTQAMATRVKEAEFSVRDSVLVRDLQPGLHDK